MSHSCLIASETGFNGSFFLQMQQRKGFSETMLTDIAMMSVNIGVMSVKIRIISVKLFL
jgi:hypothetical protein